jgi:hypothetical protein
MSLSNVINTLRQPKHREISLGVPVQFPYILGLTQLKIFQLDSSFCAATKQKVKLKHGNFETGSGFLLFEILIYALAIICFQYEIVSSPL